MSISIYQIKKWYRMLTGRSVWHVNQDIGKSFAKGVIRGYYNNLTEKVTMMPDLLDSDILPQVDLADGTFTYFPVAIFQYGLGAYDLFLQTKDERYKRKFMQCVEWAVEHQDEDGRWDNFSHFCSDAPYGAMAQGEAASLLIRAFIHTGEEKYLFAAQRAIDFMLIPLQVGGTTKYDGDEMLLMEYTNKGVVLNGFIFSWWGLYDYVCVTNDSGHYRNALEKSQKSLINVLPSFKCPYWSMYSLDGLIASPFYHNLHIAQMQAMYQLTDERLFLEYSEMWARYQRNLFCKSLAFTRKAFQKIVEKV